MVKRAILIGSTYHQSGEKTEIPGVFTDIIQRRNNLIDSFEYHSENIMILTDQYMQYSPEIYENYTDDYKIIMIKDTKIMYSSKNNIFYIINEMIKKSKPDDELFVQFAGHGIQYSYNPLNKESDNKDEVYLALNSRGQIENITDNELFKLFNKTPCKTIIIFDNCHSATIMDAPHVINYDIKKDKLVIRNENKNFDFNKNILVISGARDEDFSYDGPNRLSLQRTGIFTLSLIESQRKLLKENNEIKAGNLLRESAKWLHKFHNNKNVQQPHISGNIDSLQFIEDYVILNKNTTKNKTIKKRTGVFNKKRHQLKKLLFTLLS